MRLNYILRWKLFVIYEFFNSEILRNTVIYMQVYTYNDAYKILNPNLLTGKLI